MKLLLDGQLDKPVVLFNGEDKVFNVRLFGDAGEILASTGETWSVEFYATKTRGTAVLSGAYVTDATASSATFGIGSVTLTDVQSALFTAGVMYYAFAKIVDAGGLITFSQNYVPVSVK